MKYMYKIFFVLVFLYACKREDPHVSMSLVSRDFISDIEVVENQRIPVTEYYSICVKNYLYDTLSIGITHFQNSDIRAVQSDHISHYDANGHSTGDDLIFGTKPDTILVIPYSSEKQILFYLPGLLDSIGYHVYKFSIEYDSSGVKKRRNLPLSSKIKDYVLILK